MATLFCLVLIGGGLYTLGKWAVKSAGSPLVTGGLAAWARKLFKK